MTLSPALVLHIGSGLTAIVAGTAALVFRKGSPRHRLAGNVFFISMLGLAGTGALMGALKSETGNAMAGLFTMYLVATAWTTVRRKEGQVGRLEKIAALYALALAFGAFALGMGAAGGGDSGEGQAGGLFVVGTLAALCALFDARLIARGGISGAKRIVRHAGRMCGAMFIATGSLFLGQQQVFPEALRGTFVLAMPVIVLVAVILFWIIRIRFTGWYVKARPGALPESGGTGAL